MLTPSDLERLRGDYAHCFACGRENPLGLGLDGFRAEDGEVVVGWVPRPEYAGFAGILHGGVVATALDEICAWSAMLTEGVLVLTATLELRYRAQAPVDASYRLAGRVDERRGRRLRISGSLQLDGAEVAAASGVYLVHASLGPAAG